MTQQPEETIPEAVAVAESTATFESLGLAPRLLEVLNSMGWTKPTPIQEKAIPHVLAGHDLIGVAQTGTGKTGAFLLPIINKIAEPTGRVQALILLPTRELALQVGADLGRLTPAFGLKHAVIYGGASIGQQRLAIKNGCDILVATPGRLIDMNERTLILWSDLKYLVLDEADRMLDMGFQPDVEKILRRLPMSRRTLLFTATFAPEIKKLAETYMLSPVEVTIGYNRTVASGVTQYIYPVRQDQKAALLIQLLLTKQIDSGIVFCRTKVGTDQLGRGLRLLGLNVGILHADRPQSEREQTLESFRKGHISLLVATDVASRGLDITGVTHVINMDVPSNPDDYIHRAGRTARNKTVGDAITLVSPQEEGSFAAVQKLLGRTLERSALEDFPYKDKPRLELTPLDASVKALKAGAPAAPAKPAGGRGPKRRRR